METLLTTYPTASATIHATADILMKTNKNYFS